MHVKHYIWCKVRLLWMQDVTVVVHVASVKSFQLGSASRSFEAGFDGWLSAMICVQLATALWNRDHNQHQFIFLYIILLILFRYLCVIQYVASKIDFSVFLNITSKGSCRNFWGLDLHNPLGISCSLFSHLVLDNRFYFYCYGYE